MAIAALHIPTINPLRFLPQEGELPADPRNNVVQFDADWFVNYIRDWQNESEYVQLWQYNDKIPVHFHTNGGFFPDLKLIDCAGKVWHTWTPTVVYNAAGTRIKVGGTYVPADTYHIKLKLSEVVGLPEGIYLFHLVQTFDLDGDTVADFTRNNVSEPFSVATNHYGSSYLDYYHSSNAHDVLFTQTNARFSLRLSADVQDYAFPIKSTVYEDGSNDARLLAGRPYRKAKYVTTERLPEWMWEKLAYAFSCDNLSFEGKKITLEPGADFEPNRIARAPKISLSLPIRMADNKEGARQVVVTAVTVYTIPSYPYVVNSLSLNDVSSVPFLTSPVLINDPTEETAFISDLNTIASDEGYSGSFSVAGGDVIWTNVGSDLFLSGSASLMFLPLSYEIDNTVAEAINFNGVANVVVSWGDGTPLQTIIGFGLNTGQHTFVGSGPFTIQVFGVYSEISFNDGYLENVLGVVPSMLTKFTIVNSFTITSFNAAVVAPAFPVLTTLTVAQCSSLATVSGLLTTDLPSISFVNFASNALSTTEASNIVIAVDSSVSTNAGPLYGYLFVNNQSPAAPLNFSGTASAASLASNGWTVTND